MSNFDKIVERRGTGSEKWDFLSRTFGSDDLIPMWIADMDFQSPKPVIDAIIKRAEHGIFGYTDLTEEYYETVVNWFERRYKWSIKREWIVYTPGVIPAISTAIATFTNPGDKIIVQPPVYYPFFRSVESNGRRILANPLVLHDKRYEMNFRDLEEKAKDPRARMIILCNPHNPVGRVWRKEELERLGEIAIENNLIVVSDEIHSDIRYPGISFKNFASISEELADISITCTSPSKTFNLAGIKASNIIVPNRKMREMFRSSLEAMGISKPNVFAEEAVKAAYREGEGWLNDMLNYLKGNLDFLKRFVEENMPEVEVIEPEGTYLVWMDFRKVESDPKKLERLMRDIAKVALDEGYIFGSGGEGFERINIACPRSMLERALVQIADAVKRYKEGLVRFA
ncbi:pyridoxal phosphate-dependent aminotransferase [Fervidicoccus fontis]|uniref:cysteine-S-conjugate beta-lyase n=2 Tax=Fervidicoccus fontis TaxID=683846 RepID=I0A110_FERFK|nr:MalY/PatB family protein [Fervidicoccus fontis]AFH42667.1 aminotransferase, classes I and II [Fervidicoccus fontis Kam940]MBE9391247.1 pyridoxal phosphate-dependent aminotransferase [Fervidicoccus fontis]PNV81861.1 MAG: putative succinyldiaminopimelate transaminase DapC [Fervidicoccus sp.]